MLITGFHILLSRPLLYGLVSHFVNSNDNGEKVFLRGASLPAGTTGNHTVPGPDA